MTDKEQVIINGVNVSGCVSFDKLNGQNICCYEDTREDKIPFANFCVENKDCYFKQLARKTQECEELKKKLNTSEEWRIKAENLNEKQDLENTRYRKALEEIEEIVKETCRKRCTNDCLGTRKHCGYGAIFDIVNKAKGGEKCQ